MHADNGLEGDLSEASASDVVAVVQPGGCVLHVDGEPVGISSIEEEVNRSLVNMAAYYPWCAPLVEAAVCVGLERDAGVRRAAVISPWGNEHSGSYTDEAKHAAYVDHIRTTIAAMHPWLWALLDSAQAVVLMAPGAFAFTLPTQPGAQFEVPDFGPLMALEYVGADPAVIH